MKATRWSTALVLLALVIPPIALVQNQVPQGSLGINGQPGLAPVIQVNGKSYVDLEALARVANGSLDFSGSQVMLWLPGSTRGTAPAQPAIAGKPPDSGFSQDFLRAGIEEMSSLREWRSVLHAVVQNSYPVNADWMANYSASANRNLRLMEVAATTQSDRSAMQLIRNELSKMQQLSDQIVAKRKTLDYMDPATLDNDPLNQQIIACGHSLTAMAAAGSFQDDGTCH